MNEHQQAQWVHLVTWTSLPRTLAMLLGATMFALMSTTINRSEKAIEVANLGIASCLFIWFGSFILCNVVFRIGTLLHDLVWSFFSWLIIFISLQPVKTVVYFVLVGIALWNGASIILTILYFGGLWLFDYYTLTSYSRNLPK